MWTQAVGTGAVVPVRHVAEGKVKEPKGTNPGFPGPPLNLTVCHFLEVPWESRFHETHVRLSTLCPLSKSPSLLSPYSPHL